MLTVYTLSMVKLCKIAFLSPCWDTGIFSEFSQGFNYTHLTTAHMGLNMETGNTKHNCILKQGDWWQNSKN